MKIKGATLFLAAVLFLCSIGIADAGREQCAEDYRRFCSEWGLGTRGLANCMRRPGGAAVVSDGLQVGETRWC